MTKASDAPEITESAQPARRMIGGDADRDQIQTIDIAAAILDQSRAAFVVGSAVDRARAILAERGIPIPAEAA